MKIKHLVKVHFDRRKPGIDSEWLRNRYKLFQRTTLRSLQAQTFQDWELWASFGVNTTIQDQLNFTVEVFPGRRVLMSKNDQHAPSVSWSKEVPEDVDYVYVTRIDSDDLYGPEALQRANGCHPDSPGRVEASMFRRGYLHDIQTGEVGVYHGSSTPFHTMMFPRGVFSNPERYAEVDYGDHSVVNTRYPTKVLPDWQFAVLVHGQNFISDMSYGRERGKGFGVEREWTVDKFLNPPIVFDVDDFCDDWNCLPELDRLRENYPDFRCTVFAIPERTSVNLLAECSKREWLEVGIHGITHEPNEELRQLDPRGLDNGLHKILGQEHLERLYAKVFRPPGWYATPQHCHQISQHGLAVAIHEKDERGLSPHCSRGYYVCRPGKHGHYHTSGPGQRAHSVCKNGIKECLPEILDRWSRNRQFAKVSESLLRSV